MIGSAARRWAIPSRCRDQGGETVGLPSESKLTKSYRLPPDVARAVAVRAAESGVRPCEIVELLLRRHLPVIGDSANPILPNNDNEVK